MQLGSETPLQPQTTQGPLTSRDHKPSGLGFRMFLKSTQSDGAMALSPIRKIRLVSTDAAVAPSPRMRLRLPARKKEKEGQKTDHSKVDLRKDDVSNQPHTQDGPLDESIKEEVVGRNVASMTDEQLEDSKALKADQPKPDSKDRPSAKLKTAMSMDQGRSKQKHRSTDSEVRKSKSLADLERSGSFCAAFDRNQPLGSDTTQAHQGLKGASTDSACSTQTAQTDGIKKAESLDLRQALEKREQAYLKTPTTSNRSRSWQALHIRPPLPPGKQDQSKYQDWKEPPSIHEK